MGRLPPAEYVAMPVITLCPVGQATGAGGLSEASLKAYEELNQFLSAFIERVSQLALCNVLAVLAR